MSALLGYADIVIDYYNSGAGPIDDGPYGGTYPGSYPVAVPLSHVLGNDGPIVDFVSLPTGSYITVGFKDEVVIDGVGDDIFITEVAARGERAEIYVRAGKGAFTLLGVADGGSTSSFDLSDINFNGFVSEVKIVGLDNNGGSPGYDVVNIRALTAGLIDLSESNTLDGSSTGDIISLGKGKDNFHGLGGNDQAFGNRGNDKLFGNKGKDLLDGGKGSDKLFGGAGNDEIYGGAGKDRIVGGKGDDMLYGGSQADVFVFAGADGNDTIFDFEVGLDMIKIKGKTAQFTDLTISQSGDDAIVDYDATTITLTDINASDLSVTDFIFQPNDKDKFDRITCSLPLLLPNCQQ